MKTISKILFLTILCFASLASGQGVAVRSLDGVSTNQFLENPTNDNATLSGVTSVDSITGDDPSFALNFNVLIDFYFNLTGVTGVNFDMTYQGTDRAVLVMNTAQSIPGMLSCDNDGVRISDAGLEAISAVDFDGSIVLSNSVGNAKLNPISGNFTLAGSGSFTGNGSGLTSLVPVPASGHTNVVLEKSDGSLTTNDMANFAPRYSVSVSGGYSGSSLFSGSTLYAFGPQTVNSSTLTTTPSSLWMTSGGPGSPGSFRTITNISLSATGSTGPLPVTTNLTIFICTNAAGLGTSIGSGNVAGGATFNCNGSALITNFAVNIPIYNTNLWLVGLSNGSPSTVNFRVSWIIDMN